MEKRRKIQIWTTVKYSEAQVMWIVTERLWADILMGYIKGDAKLYNSRDIGSWERSVNLGLTSLA